MCFIHWWERMHSQGMDKTIFIELCLFQRHGHVLSTVIFSLEISSTYWHACSK